MKGLLDNTDAFEFLLSACNSLSQAKIPRDTAEALMGCRLTALNKPDGGVRVIATGCSPRQLVARTLAKQFCYVFEADCSPFQHALSTRAGTDCICHMSRAARDANPTATILIVEVLMGLGRTTMFIGQRCWPGWCRCPQQGHCCHLCGCLTLGLPVTRGTMMRGSNAPSHTS